MANLQIDPLGLFGNQFPNNAGAGADATGDDVELGKVNTADANDATLITVFASNNAALVAVNRDDHANCIGVFGTSRGSKKAIGVLGSSSAGAGVYGIATDENQTTFGIGVVGRSMSGADVEQESLEEDVLGEPIGVLGHSMKGPGVRGHGGPLLTLPKDPLPPVIADPGGVFSSGQLQDTVFVGGQGTHVVSVDSLPQLRLIPSVNRKLPAQGRFGDLFVNITPSLIGVALLNVNMYLCVSAGDGSPANVAMWAPFVLGETQKGGQ